MRPPYGDLDDRVRAISRGLGMTPGMFQVFFRRYNSLTEPLQLCGVVSALPLHLIPMVSMLVISTLPIADYGNRLRYPQWHLHRPTGH